MNEAPQPAATEAELVAIAAALAGEFRTSPDCVAGSVAAALLSASGRVYTGVCVDTACGLGFCAEHAAVAEMLKARESHVVFAVAVAADDDGGRRVIPPCGRCRELLWQLDPRNHAAGIVVGPGRVLPLSALLPEPWRAPGA